MTIYDMTWYDQEIGISWDDFSDLASMEHGWLATAGESPTELYRLDISNMTWLGKNLIGKIRWKWENLWFFLNGY